MYFLEPFKTRTYPLIVGDWTTDSFTVHFDDGKFVYLSEEKAIYFFANITKLTPVPTTKYKPEDFVWSPPVQAMFSFHHEEYFVNTKESGEWKKKKEQPGIVEAEICKFLLTQDSYLNVPVSGILDFANSNMSRKALQEGDEEVKTQWMENMLAIYTLDQHTPGFNFPEIASKKSGSSNYKAAYKKASLQETVTEKERLLTKIIADVLPIIPANNPVPFKVLIDSLTELKKEDPHRYSVLMDCLNILIK
jgi:hypothetical protein